MEDRTLLNTAPAVTLTGPATANEADTLAFNFTTSDPDPDTFPLAEFDCGNNGASSNFSYDARTGSGSFECTYSDDSAESIVSATVTDSDDLSGSDSITVVVSNVAPTVSLTGTATANEGDTGSYAFTLVDPGADVFAIDSIDCGSAGTPQNTSFDPATGAGSFDCLFFDNMTGSGVSVTVADDDGGSGSDSIGVEVANVAPEVSLGLDDGSDLVNEGDTNHHSFTVFDPGADTFLFDFDCGTNGEVSNTNFDDATGSGVFDCTYSDDSAGSLVSLSVTDDDGGTGDAVFDSPVVVRNVAPVVALVGPATVDEGDTPAYIFSVTDPGADTLTIDSVECGDDGTLSNFAFDPDTGAGGFECTFPDDSAGSIVHVAASDDDGGSGSDSITVVVSNIAPIVTLTGPDTANESDTNSYSFTVFDPGDDTFPLFSADCGAGGMPSNLSFDAVTGAGGFDCTYLDDSPGSVVSVTVTDDDGGNGSGFITVVVSNVAPTVTLAGPATANEGDTHAYSFTVLDPGTDTFELAEVSCGSVGTLSNLSLDSSTGAGSFACSFSDDSADATVAVTVTDDDGGSGTDSISVAVSNIPPTVTIVGPDAADEGGTNSYSFTVFDPGADTFALHDFDCGSSGEASNVAFDPATGAGGFDCSFSDDSDGSLVSVTVLDDDGGSGSDSVSVTVSNVAPVVTLVGPGLADEGNTLSYSFAVTDPGSDTFVLDRFDCGTEGTASNVAFDSDTGSGSFDCTYRDDSAASAVSVTVSDDDGGSDSDSVTVVVRNVAPVVTLTGSATANEGDTNSYAFTTVDPGADTFPLFSADCGPDGMPSNLSFNAATGAGSFDCTYSDDSPASVVSVSVDDDDGGSGSDSISVVVSNVAPTVTLAGPATADEGDTLSFAFTVSDPGADALSLDAVECGDNGTASNASFDDAAHAGSFDCTYSDDSTGSIVLVTVADDDGGVGSDSTSVTVRNVAPIVTLTGPATADESDTNSYSFTVVDPGADTFPLISFDCGLGGTGSNLSFDAVTGAGGFDCTYLDDSAGSVARVTVTDDDGGIGSDSINVLVSNVPPIVTLAGRAAANEGDTNSYLFSVLDPGADTFSLSSFDCGLNGTAANLAFNPATGSGSFDCTYSDDSPGSIVSVTVDDDDGGSDSETITVVVSNVAPTVSVAGPSTAVEGSTNAYSFAVSDPGADTFSLTSTDCGVNGTLSGLVFDPATGAGGFDCTYSDESGASIVEVTIADDDGGSGSGSIRVAVGNDAPVVTLTGPTTADEGDTNSYSFSVSDPGSDVFTLTSFDCGSQGTSSGLSFDPASGAGSFQCSYADDSSGSVVSVTVSDNDGGVGSDSLIVVVGNVPPTVTLVGPATADEGGTNAYSFTVSDPGADTFPTSSETCGANGALSDRVFDPATGSGSFRCTYSDSSSGSVVRVTVTDDDGGSGSDSITVTVGEVAPTVTLTGPATVDEGGTSLYSFSTSDPGDDTFTLVGAGCGPNGSLSNLAFDSASGSGSFLCTFPDGPAASMVSVQVRDSDGLLSNVAAIVVAVSNVAPTVTLNVPGTTVEAQTERYSFSTSDPGQDSFSLLLESCGDNATLVGSTFDPATGSGDFDCTFPDGPANSTVQVQVRDTDGANSNTAFIVVAIANAAPTVVVSGPDAVDEGQTAGYSFTAADPGTDTLSLLSADCGSNGTLSNLAFNAAAGAGSFDCTFPDGPANSTVSVQVADSDGDPGDAGTVTVAVANIAPTVSLTGPSAADEGQTRRYDFTTVDPGTDTFSLVSSSCGAAGTLGSVAFDPATGAGSFECTFPDGPANSLATVQVADSDGDAGNTASVDVAVANVAPMVTLTGPASVAQGATKTYSFAASDPGTDTFSLLSQTCGTTGTLSNPAFDSATGAGSFDCNFPVAPATNDVTVQVADSDADASNVATLSVTVGTEADLAVTTTDSPDPVFAGRDLTYSVTVSNSGPSAATDVTLHDDLPSGVIFAAANVGTTITLTAAIDSRQEVPTNPSTASGALTLTYHATSGLFDVDVRIEGLTLAELTASHLHLAPTGINGPVIISFGGGAQWFVDGTGIRRVITGATFSDDANFTAAQKRAALLAGHVYFNAHTAALPGGVVRGQVVNAGSAECSSAAGVVDCTLPTLAPGDSAVVTLAVSVAPATRGTLSNRATASGAESDPNLANNSDTEDTSVATRAEVSLNKTDSPDPVIAGQDLVYTSTITNAGPSTATGVSFSDTLPAGVAVATVNVGNTINLNAILSAGQEVPPVPSAATGLATASYNVVSGTLDIDVFVQGITLAELAASHIHLAPVGTNGPVILSLGGASQWVNDGAGIRRVITGATLTDDANFTAAQKRAALLAGHTYFNVHTFTRPGGEIRGQAINSGSAACSSSAGTVNCSLNALPPGASAIVTIAATVDPAVRGTLTNSATVAEAEPDPIPANNTDIENTTVAARADLAASTSDSADPVIAGETLLYTVNVSNAGPSTATAVTLRDTLPSGARVLAADVGTVFRFNATLDGGQEVPASASTASGTATLSYDTANASFDIDVFVQGIPLGNLFAAHLHLAPSGTNGPVIFDLGGAAQWVVDGAGIRRVIRGATFSDDPVFTAAQKAAALLAGQTYVNLHTALEPAGEVRGQVVGSGSAACSASAGTVNCSLGTLAPAGSTAVTIAVAVDPATRGPLSNVASVTGTESDPNPANNSDTEVTTVAARADLAVSKTDSPDPVTAGRDLVYTVTVSNAGPSTATSVGLSDLLPSGASLAAAGVGSLITLNTGLDGGQEVPSFATAATGAGTVTYNTQAGTLDVDLFVQGITLAELLASHIHLAPAGVNGPVILDLGGSSQWFADGGGIRRVIAGATFSGDALFTAAQKIAALLSGHTYVNVHTTRSGGGEIRGQVTNAGTGDCSAAAGTVTCGLGTLAPGTSTTVTIALSVGARTRGSLSNSVSVSGGESDPDASNNSDTQATSVLAQADLALVKQDSPDPVIAGRDLMYAVTAFNSGPSTATNVTVIDALPPGASFVAANVGDTINLSATLDNGQEVPPTINPSTASGTATVTYHTLTGSFDANIFVQGITLAQLSASHFHLAPAGVAGPVIFSLGGSSQWFADGTGIRRVVTGGFFGDDPNFTAAQKVAALLAGHTYLNVHTPAAPGGEIRGQVTGVGSTTCGLSAGNLTCSLADLAPGTSTRVTIAVAVDPAARGTLTNGALLAAAESDPFPGDTADTENTTVVASANLSVTKTDSPDPVIAGQDLTYSVRVTNAGPSTATNVSLTDTLPAGVAVVNLGGANCTSTSGTVSCGLGTLAPGGSAIVTIAVTFAPTTQGALSNRASASAVETDPNVADNTGVASTTVVTRANLAVTKGDGETTVTAGDAVRHTYTITVSNAGPSDAAGVTLSDVWPAGFARGTITPPTGASCTTTTGQNFTCDLGTIAAGASKAVTIGYTVPITTSPGPQTNSVTVSSVTTDPDAGNNTASDATTVVEAAEASPGNVTARVRKGVLGIRGDSANNAVLIVTGASAGCPTGLCVRGLRGTTIGGAATPIQLSGVKHIDVRLGRGNDSVFIVGSDGRAAITGNLTIDTSDGNDVVELDSVSVGGRTRIEMGRGNDRVNILDALFSRSFRLNGSSGDDQIGITDSQFLAPVVLLARTGNDLLTVIDSIFEDRVTVDRTLDLTGLIRP